MPKYTILLSLILATVIGKKHLVAVDDRYLPPLKGGTVLPPTNTIFDEPIRPESQLITLESERRPQFSNVTFIPYLIATNGHKAFTDTSLEHVPLRSQTIYIQYCYEIDAESIMEKCQRVSLLPDSMFGDAKKSLPPYFEYAKSPMIDSELSLGVFSSINLQAGLVFGPYLGVYGEDVIDEGIYAWNVNHLPVYNHAFVNGEINNQSNWMKYVNGARWSEEQNMIYFENWGNIYYILIKDVMPGDELLVYYGENYMSNLGYKPSKGWGSYDTMAPKRKYITCTGNANCK